jgi:hypothetical protein
VIPKNGRTVATKRGRRDSWRATNNIPTLAFAANKVVVDEKHPARYVVRYNPTHRCYCILADGEHLFRTTN